MAGLSKRMMGQGSANAHLPCAPSRVAALEASGTLATLYPVAFSSHLVPKLAEELCMGMCLWTSVACPFPGRFEGHHTVKPCLPGYSGESDLARENGPTKCSRHLRCLQALSAVSTHPSIVKETLPLLLQHLCQINKGNDQDWSTRSWAEWEL